MAGDWIKFEKSTLDKPEVFEIASILEIDADAVVGKLLRVWNWFDDQSVDGNAPVTVRALLDRYSGVSKFTSAMESVGWLIVEGESMSLPNFDRHNGQSAKKRCDTNRRVAKSRSKNKQCNENVTPKALPKALPEKRIEEKKIEDREEPPKSPKGDGVIDPPKNTPKKFQPPTKDEFIAYLVTAMPAINDEWTKDRTTKAASLQFDTYEENDWKDGNQNPVKIWKTKAKKAMSYQKPWSFGEAKKKTIHSHF